MQNFSMIQLTIIDAQNANKQYLVDIWQKIKDDKLNHVSMLKDALEKEIHGG